MKAFFLSMILALASSMGASLAVAASDAAAQLSQRLATMHTFSADFTQTVLDGGGELMQSTAGEMVVKRPGQMYWQTQPPLEQLLVSDGETLWTYDPDLEQVTVQAVDQRLTQTPALLLSGEVQALADSYQVSRRDLTNEVTVFELIPRDPDSLFEVLRLTFSAERLSQMYFMDSLGQRTHLEFRDVVINGEVEQDRFQFTPPPDVDVIRQ